jgi:hypothetical protein
MATNASPDMAYASLLLAPQLLGEKHPTAAELCKINM